MSLIERIRTFPFDLTPDQSRQITKQIKNFHTIAISFIFLLSISYWTLQPGTVPPCYTTACLKVANFILSTVDVSVDPCDNFRKFACENSTKKHFGKEQYHPPNRLALNRHATNAMKRMLIEPRPDENNLTVGFRLQRKFFRACLNTSAIEADDNRSILKNLASVVGGGWPWSITDEAQTSDWYELQARATERGFLTKFFLDSDIYPFPDNQTVYLELKPPSLERIWSVLPKIQSRMESITGHLYDVAYEMKQVGFFIEDLRKFANSFRRDQRDHESSKVSQLNSLRLIPQWDWAHILKRLFDVQPNDRVFYKPSLGFYLHHLERLIRATYSKKVWLNYVALTLIFEDCLFLTKAWRSFCMEESTDQKRRVDQCVEKAQEIYPKVLETQHLRETVTERHRDSIRPMFDLIKSQMINMIEHVPWLQDDVKPLVVENAERVSLIIGASDLYYNETELEETYKYNEVSWIYEKDARWSHPMYDKTGIPPTAARLAHQANLDQSQRVSKYLKNPLDYFATRKVPQSVAAAHYFIDFDEIRISGPFLAPPIYDPDQPEYVNFGALGVTIGHELSHMLTAEEDNLRRRPFWTPITQRLFDAALQCTFVAYYHYVQSLKYSLPYHVGQMANNENFADFGAINLAYQAYQTWVDQHGPEPPLIGLYLTPHQIFWIMTTVIHCEYHSDRYAIEQTHAAEDFRIMGPIMNSPYFAPDFDCPDKSRMNPKNKCKILAPP